MMIGRESIGWEVVRVVFYNDGEERGGRDDVWGEDRRLTRKRERAHCVLAGVAFVVLRKSGEL